MEETDTEAEEPKAMEFHLEVLKSYLTFAKRAILARKWLVLGLLLTGLGLTAAVYKFLPRTFRSTTVLMTVSNRALDGDIYTNAFAGVESLVMRRENLELIVHNTDLGRKFSERRPPLLKLKDFIMERITGKLDAKTMDSIAVGTLETRLRAEPNKDLLSISADWTDGTTAAEIAEAAKQSFLDTRQAAETSAFAAKMTILDTHAITLRKEIDDLAAQTKAAIEQKNAEAKEARKAKSGETAQPAPMVMRSRPALSDSAGPELKASLAEARQKLTAAEADRSGRIRDEKAKLEELKLKLTASHPQVAVQEDRVALASAVTSELALLRSEVADMEGQIKQRDAMFATGRAGVLGGPAGAGADSVPAEIMQLLSRDESDPALNAQLSGAIVRYGRLRDDMRNTRLALDAEQAAFELRYRIVIPVEVPNKPVKPNLVVVVAAGVFASLLAALLLPIMLALRKGTLVEYWQVHHLNLPVLGNLQLPGRPRD